MDNKQVDDALCLMKQRHGDGFLCHSLFTLQTLGLVPESSFIPRVLHCLGTMVARGLVETPSALSERTLSGVYGSGNVGLNVHVYAKCKVWDVLTEKWRNCGLPSKLLKSVESVQSYDAVMPSEKQVAMLKSLDREVPDTAWLRGMC